MSEFVFPCADDSDGYGFSQAERTEIELLANAVADIEILLREPVNQHHYPRSDKLEPAQIATDTVENLDDWQ